MLTYVIKLKQDYQDGKLTAAKYVENLLLKYYDNAVCKPGFQIRGIKALSVIMGQKKPRLCRQRKDIHNQAGFPPNYAGCGMWGWVQSDIVEKFEAPVRYRIRPQFYQDIVKTLSKFGC